MRIYKGWLQKVYDIKDEIDNAYIEDKFIMVYKPPDFPTTSGCDDEEYDLPERKGIFTGIPVFDRALDFAFQEY